MPWLAADPKARLGDTAVADLIAGLDPHEVEQVKPRGTARLKQFERLLRRAMERAEVQVVTCLLTLRSSTTEFPTRMAEKPRAII